MRPPFLPYLVLLAGLLQALPAAAQDARPESSVRTGIQCPCYAVSYPDHMQGRSTASGERYSSGSLTIAHPTLPLGAMVQLESERTGRRTTVRVNDRGVGLGAGEMIVSPRVLRELGESSDAMAEVRATRVVQATDVTLAMRRQRTAPETGSARTGDSRAATGDRTGRATAPQRTAPVTTTPAPRTNPPPQPRTGPSQFAIQLGAYTDRATAEAVAATMTGTWVQNATVDGRSLHRVFFGRYTDREEAEGWQARLESLGIDGYVRTLR